MSTDTRVWLDAGTVASSDAHFRLTLRPSASAMMIASLRWTLSGAMSDDVIRPSGMKAVGRHVAPGEITALRAAPLSKRKPLQSEQSDRAWT